jgi:hypothetical protein
MEAFTKLFDMRNILFFSLIFLVACVLLGCGGQRAPRTGHVVGGKVTFADGTPLNDGQVTFHSGRFSASGSIMTGGSYSIKVRVPLGTYRVAVWANDNPLAGVRADMVNPKFGDPATSGLVVEVKGPTAFNIEVE